MKAISIKQPWASMILNGQKTIETRMWSTDYRGPLLIVSSKQPVLAGHLSGMALCVVDLVDCRRMELADARAACCEQYLGAWAWALANVRPIEPFPIKGHLGLYGVDDSKIRIEKLETNEGE